MRRAAIVWKADRTALADESVAAVAVHANRTGDRMRNAITDDFYGEKRPEAMNELARRFAARCIALGEAGILAIAEGHPARVAEDL